MSDLPVTTALTIIDPVQSIDRVKMLGLLVKTLYKDVLTKDLDYGVIPGTGDKPTLLLPGMEKLMRALNAVPRYLEKRVIVDYDKPLFHYEYECQLIDADTGQFLPGGIGLGLCTSMESSFRFRTVERACPKCGEPLRKSKNKPEYYCWAKIGGCGATFPDNDPDIINQPVGKVDNPNIFDQINAIMKRAKKRALGDAIKGAAAVSELFTVDLEDFVEGDYVEMEDVHKSAPFPKPQTPLPVQTEPRNSDAWNMTELVKATKHLYANDFEQTASLAKHTGEGGMIGNITTGAAVELLTRYKTKQRFETQNVEVTKDELDAFIVGALDMSLTDWRKAGKPMSEAWSIIQEALAIRFPEIAAPPVEDVPF